MAYLPRARFFSFPASAMLLAVGCNSSVDDNPGTFSSTTGQPTSITSSGTGDATGSTSGGSSGSTGGGNTDSATTGSTDSATTGTSGSSGSTGAPDPVCGNGSLEGDEECDDGNLDDADGCEADCTKPACDNGIIDPQEVCQTLAGSFDAGTDPSALEVADFNADGTDDVATVSPNDNAVTRFLFGTDGMPTATDSYVSGLTPTRIDSGDIDDDTDLDLFVLSDGTNQALRLLNDGTGVFGSTEILATGTDTVSLIAGQIDLDGKVDFVMADIIAIANPPNPVWVGPALRIYQGDGAGVFTETAFQQTDGVISDIEIAKMDGDGLPDFVVVTGSPSIIRVYAGSNVGNVDPAGSSLLPGVPTSFALGHADDDDILDAVVSVEDDDDLYLLGGDGNAQFLFSDKLPLNAVGAAVTFVDLDADGKQDLAAATATGELHLLRRVGPGQFITEQIEMLSGPPSDIGTSDFNGDGLSDIVVTVPSMGKLDVILSAP